MLSREPLLPHAVLPRKGVLPRKRKVLEESKLLPDRGVLPDATGGRLPWHVLPVLSD